MHMISLGLSKYQPIFLIIQQLATSKYYFKSIISFHVDWHLLSVISLVCAKVILSEPLP